MTNAKKKVVRSQSRAQAPRTAALSPTGVVDVIASNRQVEPVTAADVPTVPNGYRPVDILERRRRLTRVDVTSRAELLGALHELSALGPQVRADLGDDAPDPSAGTQLAARIDALGATIDAAQAVVDAHAQLLEIALSDAHDLAAATFEHYDPIARRRPALAQSYRKLVEYITLRGNAISEGMARARRTPDSNGSSNPTNGNG